MQKIAKKESTAPQTPLDLLSSFVQEEINQVNDLIVKRLENPVTLIPKLAGYLINSGGKRIRPLLALAVSKICGYRENRQISLSACIEFIHTATLLHDDVVDESNRRRGQETANIVWGNQASVLVGDFLFSKSFEIMVEDGDLEILKVLSKASSTIIEGEVMQLSASQNTTTQVETYYNIIMAKTAELFAASCHIGTILTDQPDYIRQSFIQYGLNLGLAFQLVDDVLDYTANEEILGKSLGNDFMEAKVTLPVIHAYEKGSIEEKAFWERTFNSLNQKPGDFEHAVELLKTHKAFDYTLEQAQMYSNKARDSLSVLPNRMQTYLLADVADYCVSRIH